VTKTFNWIFYSGLGKTNFKLKSLAAGVRCAQRKVLLLMTAEKSALILDLCGCECLQPEPSDPDHLLPAHRHQPLHHRPQQQEGMHRRRVFNGIYVAS